MADVVVPLHKDGLVPAVVCEPDEELIAKLEKLVAEAKSGQLRALACVLIDRDRAIATGWCGHASHHDMTAGVNILAFRYMGAGIDD